MAGGDTIGSAAYELTARQDGLLRDLKSADTAVRTSVAGTEKTAATTTSRMGETMARNVSRGTALAGAALGAFVASGVQEFGRFDDQMRQVFSILPGISDEAMSSMEDQVKSLALEMGRLPEDIIPGLYDALSSGIPQENVFTFLEAATKGAIAGGASTQETVKVLAATINAFGLDVADTEEITDSFFNAINLGVTTFPELAASMA